MLIPLCGLLVLVLGLGELLLAEAGGLCVGHVGGVAAVVVVVRVLLQGKEVVLRSKWMNVGKEMDELATFN